MQKWILLISLMLLLSFSVISHATENNNKENILRLHVIANSDREEDQNLKLVIRDQVLKNLEPLKDINSSQEAKKYIEKNINSLKALLEEEIKKEGYKYQILIEFGESDFPTRKYNGFILPAGKYQALKVIIGGGQGANWWCVLFPPICHGDWVQERQKIINEENTVSVMADVQEATQSNFDIKRFSHEYFSLLRKVWSFSKTP